MQGGGGGGGGVVGQVNKWWGRGRKPVLIPIGMIIHDNTTLPVIGAYQCSFLWENTMERIVRLLLLQIDLYKLVDTIALLLSILVWV